VATAARGAARRVRRDRLGCAHHLRKIAGHGSLTTTLRYLHPDQVSITAAGHLLSTHLNAGPDRARLRVV
jgi:hypothetical protein